MNVLIAGGGRTGATVARTLAAAGHEVRLLEHRPDVLAHLHRELPTEIIYEGNAGDPRTLELASRTSITLRGTSSSDTESIVCGTPLSRSSKSPAVRTSPNRLPGCDVPFRSNCPKYQWLAKISEVGLP